MNYTEDDVHKYMYATGLEELLPPILWDETPSNNSEKITLPESSNKEEENFHLWKVIKEKALEKINRIHGSMYESEFIGSKLNLPTDDTRPMELDFLGKCEEGLFILELKVKKSAERNAFTELLGYSNYFAELFSLSSHRDITNVLVAKLDAKITKQAYLYDLLINDRNTIVYTPNIQGDDVESLSLEPYIPDDSEFEHFATTLLGHESMSCIVVSFHDLDEWFDSKEDNGSLNSWTKKHLDLLSAYTAQLMEAEKLHGFCYIRKPWDSIPLYYRNSLVICAVNPFLSSNTDRAEKLNRFLSPEALDAISECASSGFYGRLIRLGQKAIKDSLTHDYSCEIELPLWAYFLENMIETAFVHNFSFKVTGLLRDAYVSDVNSKFEKESIGESAEDLSILKVNEVNNWLKAWEFMRACGYVKQVPDHTST